MRYIFILSALLLTVSSCSDTKQALYEGYVKTSFVIPLNRVNSFQQLTVFLREEPTFYNENLSVNGITNKSVKSVLPGRARIKSSFQDIDLGFLSNISIRAIDRSTSTTKEMFYLSDIRLFEGNTIELFPSLSELKPILSNPEIDLAIVMNFKGFPSSDVEISLDFSYQVFDQ